MARVNDEGFIVETGLGLAPGTNLYTTPQPAESVRGEPIGYIMPTALKQLKAGGNAVVGSVSQGGDVPLYTAPHPAEPVRCEPVCFANINKQGDVTRTSKKRDGWAKTPLYLAPQPNEPVKVPSDADIDDLWELHEDSRAFARALLARYGRSQP